MSAPPRYRGERRKALVANLGMAAGFIIWLSGELFGVWNNQHGSHHGKDTTTEWMSWVRPHQIAGLFLLVGGSAALIGHFFGLFW